ncbi:Uncharacterized protein TCM_024491 [Theobroma cacao]|uniref:Secreted protein n=1 Tax=Theobroma cacao TaxID=3641 RepID=A0A061EWB9_THECC|nr:Uncharacterized protein TCM_024491 [Theobroma cacao]
MWKLMLSLVGFRSTFGVMSAYWDVAMVVTGSIGVLGRDNMHGVLPHYRLTHSCICAMFCRCSSDSMKILTVCLLCRGRSGCSMSLLTPTISGPNFITSIRPYKRKRSMMQ